jgi:hypothetical protein
MQIKILSFDSGISSFFNTYYCSFVTNEGNNYEFSSSAYNVREFLELIIDDFEITGWNCNCLSVENLGTPSDQAQLLLVEEGDEFKFNPSDADPLRIKLLQKGSTSSFDINKVTIEMLIQTQVSGSLPPSNVEGLNASKITKGEFDSKVIPTLDHTSLSNIGSNTHEEIEDKLTGFSAGNAYQFNNVYQSNLMKFAIKANDYYPEIPNDLLQFNAFTFSAPVTDDVDVTWTNSYNSIDFVADYYDAGGGVVNTIPALETTVTQNLGDGSPELDNLEFV